MTQPGRKSSASKLVVSAIGTPVAIKAPAELGPEERELFVTIVSSHEPDHFRLSDLPLLCAYCRAAVLERRAGQELAREPLGPKGQPSSWTVIHSNALKSMLGLSLRLRLAPQGRQKASIKKSEPLSYYERMAIAESLTLEGHNDAEGTFEQS